MSKKLSDNLHIERQQSAGEDFDYVDQSVIGGQSASDLTSAYFRNPKYLGSMIAFFIASVSCTSYLIMLSTAITIINDDLGPRSDYIWVLLAITLGQSVIFPTQGRLGDLFGRRWFFIGANALAFIGYIVGATAKNIPTLIGANVVVGMGNSVQIAGVSVPGELMPNKMRFMVYTYISVAFGPIIALAPSISRAFCDNTAPSWRWILYFQGILSFVSMALFIVCYFPPRFEDLHKRSSKWATLKHFDFVGAILYGGSAISFLLGISWGGQQYPWKSAQTIAPLVIGIVGFVALVLWERFATLKHPFFDVKILVNRNYALLTICSSLGSMIFYALNILWPEQLEILFSLSSARTGWASCTLTAGVIFGWLVSGPIVSYLPKIHVKWQLVACATVMTAFIGAMASADGSNLGIGIAFSLIGAIGLGYLEDITITGAPLHVSAKDLGLANGLQFSIRTIFSSIASAVFVTILTNQVSSNVPGRVATAAVGAGLPQTSARELVGAVLTANATELAGVPGISPTIIEAAVAAAHQGYFKSFQVVYYVSLAFGAISIIAALCIDGKTFQSKMTGAVERKLRHIKIQTAVDDGKLESATEQGAEKAVEL